MQVGRFNELGEIKRDGKEKKKCVCVCVQFCVRVVVTR